MGGNRRRRGEKKKKKKGEKKGEKRGRFGCEVKGKGRRDGGGRGGRMMHSTVVVKDRMRMRIRIIL